jgi:uncharacterized protein
MKKAFFIIFSILIISKLQAQDITGKWNGILDVQGTQLKLVFNITKTDNGISATMDSPDQGANGIPTTSANFDNSVLKITIANIKMEYEGKLENDNTIKGTFKQAGMILPLNLSKKVVEKAKIVRPQEPIKPYSYYSEDVSFLNSKDQVTLAGTLTLPQKEGNFPVVVLISGSGPQNRDEELLGHKPFLILSDYLTKNGIGVLRYDDRGTAESKGDFKSATSQDFASDVEAAIAYLKTRKEVNKNKIGLMGHSEGGIIAPMVAANSKDVNFIVLLAGTGIKGDELLGMQMKLIAKASGESDSDIEMSQKISKKVFEMVNKAQNTEILKSEMTDYLLKTIKENPEAKPKEMSAEDFIKIQVTTFTSPWMQYFLKYNPATSLEKVKCPVLAVNGAKDLQVPSKVNLDAIKKSLEKAGNKNITTIEFPNLNHLFQECTTGSPDEYAKIEQTFSPIALKEISNWILKQVK